MLTNTTTIDVLTEKATKVIALMQLYLLSTHPANEDNPQYEMFNEMPAICLPPMRRQPAINEKYERVSAFKDPDTVYAMNPSAIPLYLTGILPDEKKKWNICQIAVDLLTQSAKRMGYQGLYDFEDAPENQYNLTRWLELVDTAHSLGNKGKVVEHKISTIEDIGEVVMIHPYNQKIVVVHLSKGIYKGFLAILDTENRKTIGMYPKEEMGIIQKNHPQLILVKHLEGW